MLSTEKNRKRVFIFALVAFFIYAFVNSWAFYHESRDLERKWIEYTKQQQEYRKLIDSARYERMRMAFHIIELQEELSYNREALDAFEERYKKKLKELERYEREEDFIPVINPSEQFQYLSDYQYRPY